MSGLNNKTRTTEGTDFPIRAKKAESTRQKILEVATEIFLAEGFSQTSLEKVAEAAATTKPTVYSHFKSKQGLFDAVVSRHASVQVDIFDKLLQPTDNPAKDLIGFGETFLPFALSEKTRQWDRLAIAESISTPEVGEVFYRSGPAKVIKRLTQYLKTQTREKRLAIPHPERASEQLIGLMIGVDILRAQIGKSTPSSSLLKKRCRAAVEVFMAAYGADNE